MIDARVCELHETSRLFRSKTNLPDTVQLQPGARVMYLNNTLFERGICNGTVGIIQDVRTSRQVRIAFPVMTGLIEVIVGLSTYHFNLNGARACRTQFPLQNAFALTVHKTQGLTLPSINISLDEQIFAKGQAYVALSRAPSWSAVTISALRFDAFRVDHEMVTEYDRLHAIANTGLLF